uniref:NADH dehydrogenase subunit 6 n=1 Tax=Phanuelus gladstone TaxID=2059714 RepID=A0A7U0R693_9ARAC|nr:NADH dehydrogenase subunit 6 [Phanuelus gladstone]QQX28282.1 NADH dehydrogenase subunit 6 [Phanuelus gladstone]
MFIILMSMLFVSGIQPMLMISMLIMIVLLYSYMIYVMMSGYWFGYVLMMVMLSGVLVLFTYMVSLIPNESFENYNLMYLMGLLFMMIGSYYYWMMDLKHSFMSIMLWSSFMSLFNLFMISFLLMIMLLVVWLSFIGCGAIRVY